VGLDAMTLFGWFLKKAVGRSGLPSPVSGQIALADFCEHFLISNFRRVVKFVCFLLGNSPASAYKIQNPGNYPEENIQFCEHGSKVCFK
jgi:hypothetical protein